MAFVRMVLVVSVIATQDMRVLIAHSDHALLATLGLISLLRMMSHIMLIQNVPIWVHAIDPQDDANVAMASQEVLAIA